MLKEWENEPNEKWFMYEGFGCLIWRQNNKEAFCGYVAIPKKYVELYGLSTDEIGSQGISAHGSITYAESGEEKGFSKDTWCIGFDCYHAGDLVPARLEIFGFRRMEFETYRNFAFVEKECKSIVDQIIEKYGVRI